MQDIQKNYWSRAYRAAFVLQLVPFIRMVGVNGSLARGEATEKSDIDFLVVAVAGRIWTCRFLTTVIVALMGIKRTANKISGRICLNRFITSDSLSIYPYDEYHARNYSLTCPILDINIYERFIIENCWMNNFSEIKDFSGQRLENSKILHRLQKAIEKILSSRMGLYIEKRLKNYQLNKIKKNILTKNNQGMIVANDRMLCFHPTSKFNLTNLG